MAGRKICFRTASIGILWLRPHVLLSRPSAIDLVLSIDLGARKSLCQYLRAPGPLLNTKSIVLGRRPVAYHGVVERRVMEATALIDMCNGFTTHDSTDTLAKCSTT